jgi:hypothetical protein
MPEDQTITVDILPRIDYVETEPVQALVRTIGAAVAVQESDLGSLIIQSDEDFARVGRGIVAVGKLEKKIMERQRTITRPIDEARRATMDLFRPHLLRLKELKDRGGAGMRDWDRKKREEDVRLLQTIAVTQKGMAKVSGIRFYSERKPVRTGR